MSIPTRSDRWRRRARPGGLALIELLLVISLFSIISLVAVPRFGHGKHVSRIRIDQSNIAYIDLQWETQRIVEGSYRSLDELLSDPDVFPEGAPSCPFGRPYVDEDGDHRVDAHAH
ncbi:MAG: type II secretion system protein [Candidatus Eiseniibacteriota bacterium]